MRNRKLQILSSIVVLTLLVLIVSGGVQHTAADSGMDGAIIYVDWEAAGGNDGSSWDDAFTDVQLALDIAASGDDIWVAAGTYYPSVEHGGSGDLYKSFQMLNEVGIYGGFDPSVGDVGWEDRDWVANVTILSGDIGTPGDPWDNCYHVFYHDAALDLDNTAILDGFTVSEGRADEYSGVEGRGGGMYNVGASPTVANCTFASNSGSESGGGMYNESSSPDISNCTFHGNVGYDDSWGGGMANYNSSPTLNRCTFFYNRVTMGGGGMYNENSNPTLTDCTFEWNYALPYGEGGIGGGMLNVGSSPILVNCIFVGNSTDWTGGGMQNDGSSPTLTNCIFEGNDTRWSGGGMTNNNSSPRLINCAFIGNSVSSPSGAGAGMSNTNSSPTLTNCTFSGNWDAGGFGGAFMSDAGSSPALTNCILWGDTPPEILGGSPFVTYSNVEGGYEGEGNIDDDPLWVDPDNEDFHLGGGSPCIDTGTNDAPYLPEFDFEGDDRVIDGDGDMVPIVDMGIDEFVPTSVHVGGMEGYFSLDYLGRPRLRIHVYAEDEGLNPLSDVQVEGAITVPCGGPYVRTRFTKPSGNARFHWGCNQPGTWTLCVEDLVREGYVYVPGDNVVTCMDWER